jgi:hypothetical protein
LREDANMTIKISKSTGGRVDGGPDTHLLAAIVQQMASEKASTITDLTDSSGGSASSSYTLTSVAGDLVNVANSGTSLAGKVTTEAKLNLVGDALKELLAKANAVAAVVGVASITDNSGMTAVDGTIAAIGTVTAVTTGAPATATNAILVVLNNYQFTVAKQINKIMTAVGGPTLVGLTTGTYASPVAAVTIATGTAADPAVSKTAMDAKLAVFTANIATMAAALNAVTGAWAVNVVVVD